MTSESHDLPDKYLGITSGGPSAGPMRTVREAVVTVTVQTLGGFRTSSFGAAAAAGPLRFFSPEVPP